MNWLGPIAIAAGIAVAAYDVYREHRRRREDREMWLRCLREQQRGNVVPIRREEP